MNESMKSFNLTITSCDNCPKLCSQAAKPGYFKATDYFCKHDPSASLDHGIKLYEQNKHGLTTCPVLAIIENYVAKDLSNLCSKLKDRNGLINES